MYEGAEPVSYEGVSVGTPVLSSSGDAFGTLQKVLEVVEEDLFDGIIVATAEGVRFVDRDQITEITTLYITCGLTNDEVAALPEPSGTPVYDVDPLEDAGGTFKDWLGKTFRRPQWKPEK